MATWEPCDPPAGRRSPAKRQLKGWWPKLGKRDVRAFKIDGQHYERTSLKVERKAMPPETLVSPKGHIIQWYRLVG